MVSVVRIHIILSPLSKFHFPQREVNKNLLTFTQCTFNTLQMPKQEKSKIKSGDAILSTLGKHPYQCK